SLSVFDKAGNAGIVDPLRTDETIYARADTLAPAGVRPIVCIGESTTLSVVGNPEVDLRTYEDPLCASACAGDVCSRFGDVALVWDAPGDDGLTGTPAGYVLAAAALNVQYSEGTSALYANCNDLTS